MGLGITDGDAEMKAALEQYEAGMKCLGQQRFERAKPFLEKVCNGPSRELAERARVHLRICEQRLQPERPSPRTADEHYDYAVLQMNSGNYEEAEEHFARAVKIDGKSAHAEYALASLYALRSEIDAALLHLREAVSLEPRYRLLARGDEDFKLLMDDPRFTEELYPEQG